MTFTEQALDLEPEIVGGSTPVSGDPRSAEQACRKFALAGSRSHRIERAKYQRPTRGAALLGQETADKSSGPYKAVQALEGQHAGCQIIEPGQDEARHDGAGQNGAVDDIEADMDTALAQQKAFGTSACRLHESSQVEPDDVDHSRPPRFGGKRLDGNDMRIALTGPK